MWKCITLCLVSLCSCGYGYLRDEMVETTQLCCDKGTTYARMHKLEDCSSSLPVPPEVPASFATLCTFASMQCCITYFKKKEACDSGVDIATSTNRCDSTQDSSKVCCDDCRKGLKVGQSRGAEGCVTSTPGNSAEELLANDAFIQCCQKAELEVNRNPDPSLQNTTNAVTVPSHHKTVLPSLCEDFAPNELCAHHCIPVPGSYKCQCNPGFMLMADKRNCREVIRNRCKPRNYCQHKCNDNGVEVKCSCKRGYELMADKKSCQDIDECKMGLPVCLAGSRCYNVKGSYKCIPVRENNNEEQGQCPPGFARNLNNNACDDINECDLPHPPCLSYLCENTIGGYKCGGITGDPRNIASSGSTPSTPVEDRCPPGFKLGANDECEDVDECKDGKDDCNPLSQFCINTHSSYHCQDNGSKHCPPGFKIDASTNKCEDINECDDGDDICRPDQICVNQLGQYDCKFKTETPRQKPRHDCPDGMRMKLGHNFCEDINECVEGTHLCDQYQNCLNTNGSYECHCKLGYELDTLTGACTDMNECATGQHNCMMGSQRCDNTVGSYLCVRITPCGTGYILHHSTGQCEDIDECALGTHNCARPNVEYECVNIPGSFRCIRKHVTTSSTTPLPEDDIEYYYTDDESGEVDNTSVETENKPGLPLPITTPKPETTSATLNTTSTVKTPIESSEKSHETSDKEDGIKIQPNTTYHETQPVITYEEEPIRLEPPQPEETYETKSPDYTKPTLSNLDPSYNELVPPTEPETPYVEPERNEQSFRPSSTESIEPEISNSIDPIPTEQPLPESTNRFLPEQTERTDDTSPNIINVEVGKKPAVIDGEINKDGSVFIDTSTIEKNKWTSVNFRPPLINCPIGFELDKHGVCFDTDECATNRHSCSGLTEVCRNTVGGYLCDCARGFRRDFITGVCDIITTSSIITSTSSPSTSSTTPFTTTSTTPSTTTSTTSSTTTSTTTPSTTSSTTTSTTSTTTPAPSSSTTEKQNFPDYPYYPYNTQNYRPHNMCDAGYHLNYRTMKCEDIDECTNGQAHCASVEICVNTEGGYRCECPPNWKLDHVRHRCMPIRTSGMFPPGYGNEPTKPPPVQKDIFSDTKGNGYVDPEVIEVEDRESVLKCPWGYTLGIDHTCEDVDECITGQANCGPLQLCTNLPGGYTCSCLSGHKLVRDHECEDVDECAIAEGIPICSQNADCINTVGSYRCQCHKGFRSAPINDKVCVDVDECTELHQGSICQQRCNNVWGGYRCSCHRGYRLNSDNTTCSDVDECVQFRSKTPCVGQCINEPGSYRCGCPSGYKLSADKRSCIDIDECETGQAICAKGGFSGGTSDVCFNTRGSYRCHRIVCPAGYQLESKHRCTKIERVCQLGDWDCAHQPSTISYNFITFVSKLYIPETKVKLFTMRGPTWPYSRMKFQLRLVDVNAPPSVKDKADISYFLLIQNNNEAVMSLLRPLEGPQSIELELSMELHSWEQFAGIAVARIFIFVSEYEF